MVYWEMRMECLSERGDMSSISEKKLILNLYAVIHKKSTVFLGKTFFHVMFFLSGYIVGYHLAVSHIVRESGVLFRPSIEIWEIRVVFQPFACSYLEILNKLGHGKCRRERYKNVYVVGHSANAEEFSSNIIDETEGIGVEIPLFFYHDSFFASMSAKHNVV